MILAVPQSSADVEVNASVHRWATRSCCLAASGGSSSPLGYTSGTESRPEGVLLSSRSLLWQYVSCVDGNMASGDVDLHTLPLYHCAQLDCFLGPDIYLGATSIILRGPDPAAILATIESERVTMFFAPPTVWISVLGHPAFDQASRRPRAWQRVLEARDGRIPMPGGKGDHLDHPVGGLLDDEPTTRSGSPRCVLN